MVLSVYLSMYLRVPEPKKPPFWGSNLPMKIAQNLQTSVKFGLRGFWGWFAAPLVVIEIMPGSLLWHCQYHITHHVRFIYPLKRKIHPENHANHPVFT